MARARRRSGPTGWVVAALLVAAGALLWWFAGRPSAPPTASVPTAPAPSAPASVVVGADRVDAANEGRRIVVEGVLRAVKPAVDPQLGISADALVLVRKVEMRQWRETCGSSGCNYALAWSEEPINSSAFKTAKGHENPPRLPFSSELFLSADVRLGAFKVDATFAANQSAAVAYPVRSDQLPPNLAATFRARDGVLYAGNDPGNAVAGDLRVSYQIIAPGSRRLGGTQVGDRLKPAAAP